MRVSQRQITAAALDTGVLAARHRRVFAGGLTITDRAHQRQLEATGAASATPEVELRPLARYDALIPG